MKNPNLNQSMKLILRLLVSDCLQIYELAFNFGWKVM